MKLCRHCGTLKKKSDFYRDRRAADGLYGHCKPCHNRKCTAWQKTHGDQCSKIARAYYYRNHEHVLARMKARDIAQPWLSMWRDINTRCTNPNYVHWKYYGGRGIKNFLRVCDCKMLWFRDNAPSMKRPSIDRIDNDGDYTIANCRIIELSENIKKKWRLYREHQRQA